MYIIECNMGRYSKMYGLVSMIKWVIRTYFDKYDSKISMTQLRDATQRAWNEMVEDGEIIIESDE